MQYDVQRRGSSDSMCWIVRIFILHSHILCTAVHASVQHRILLYTPALLPRQKVDRGRQLERGRINGHFTVLLPAGQGAGRGRGRGGCPRVALCARNPRVLSRYLVILYRAAPFATNTIVQRRLDITTLPGYNDLAWI